MRDRGFIPRSIRSNAARRTFACSAALALSLAGGLSLAADQLSQVDGIRPSTTAPAVKNRTAEKAQSTPSLIDTKVLFPATRYPFLPSLIENREPELCATVLKGAREKFFSPYGNPRMTEKSLNGITWLEWDKVEGKGYRLDLDLDGTGRKNPVVGRGCSWPGGRDGSQFFVFPSLGSLNKAASEPAWLDEGCDRNYKDGDDKSPRSTDAPVMYHPEGILAGHDRKEIDTGADWVKHRLFSWQSGYYFFADPPPGEDLNMARLTTFRLHADGTVDPRCVACLIPDKAFVQRFRGIPGISSFLMVLSTIGTQGEYPCRSCSNHDGGANAAVDRAAYRPWAVSRATSDPDGWSSAYFKYDDRTKWFLEDWSFLDIWSRREYQTFLQHFDPAVAALEKYYVSAFGLAKEEAKKAARRVIEELIGAWLLIPNGYDPEQDLYNLRRSPLNRPIFNRNREALKEEIRKENERNPDGSRDENPPYYSDYDRKPPHIEISLALHDAVEWEEGMRLLLAAGADPNAPNGFGKTPLMTAAHMNRPDTVRLLLSHGAAPNRKTGEMESWMGSSPIHRTALMYAAENAGPPVMKLLLDAGASPDELDSNGDGIGHYLARNPRLTEAEKRMDIRELVLSRSGRPIGPGFDCNKAKGQVEKAICEDEVLKMLDGEMADAFSRWVRLAGDEARNDQRRWLKERKTSCTDKDQKSDAGCLQDQTRSRVRYLHNRLAEHELSDGKKPRTEGETMNGRGGHDLSPE